MVVTRGVSHLNTPPSEWYYKAPIPSKYGQQILYDLLATFLYLLGGRFAHVSSPHNE